MSAARFRTFLLALALLSASIAVAAGQDADKARAPEFPAEALENIKLRVDRGYHVGIAAALIGPGGTRYHAYGATSASGGSPLDENSVFEIGSITKAFTSIVLARMAEQGEVALEDPLAKHLPDSVHVPVRNDKTIRLVDLATHTSGLPRLPDNMKPEDDANPYADYTFEQAYEFLSGHELRRDVGEQYEYSNYGAGLLGHALALRRDTNYEKLVRALILDELGMTNTAITLSENMQRRLAKGHLAKTEVKNWDIPTLAGAGALRSTVSDMVKFVAANMGLVESKLLAAMTTTHEPREIAGALPMRIGLGWHVLASDEETDIVWHNGGTGGYRSFAGFVKGGELGVVVLSNSSQSVDDLGMYLLGHDVELFEPQPRKKIPLFKKD